MDRREQNGGRSGGTEAQYLGMMAAVADAEALGISLAWESGDVVALDSQGVIQRVRGLMLQRSGWRGRWRRGQGC